MKKLILLASALFLGLSVSAQEQFTIEIEPLVIPNAPGVQSYSWGVTDDNKWVVLGGRIDGLHQRQPFAAFLESDNNKLVFVIDPVAENVWFSSLSSLPAPIFEQLQSTNQNFHQRDSMLYIVGGYGYSNAALDHITYDKLTAVSLNELADAVIAGNPIDSYFRQISDPNMAVTGGYLGHLDGTFYLGGGHYFEGRYNPMGPTFGPGFIQQYTNEIRTFEIFDDGTNLAIQNYSAQHDTVNLHRRDYNMAPQIFPNGELGFTMFSGVFDYADAPWFNTVDVTSTGYTVNNNFDQLLSQYHSAKLPIYDTVSNFMHTIFFGGLSQFYFDDQGVLVEDIDVPFVKTISKITRDSNGGMTETDLNYIEMPTLVGPGAEFIPDFTYFYDNEVLNLSSVPNTKTLVGYIYGGIESTAPNIFFTNDGTQSAASNVIFKVYINKGEASVNEITVSGDKVMNLEIYPNPVGKKMNVDIFVPLMDDLIIEIYNMSGALVMKTVKEVETTAEQDFKLNVSDLDAGNYYLRVQNGSYTAQKQFTKR